MTRDSHNPRCLVVEDYPPTLHALAHILATHGIEPDTVANTEDAIESLRSVRDGYCSVILDARDALIIIAEIQRLGLHTRVIAAAGSEFEQQSQLDRSIVQLVMPKPIDARALREAVVELCKNHSLPG